jgi:hypothetical protein
MLPSSRRKRVLDSSIDAAPVRFPRLRGERELFEWLQRVATSTMDLELWERGVLRSARPQILAQVEDVGRENFATVVQNFLALLVEREGPQRVHAVCACRRSPVRVVRAHLLPPGTPLEPFMGILREWFDDVHGNHPSPAQIDSDRTEALGQLYAAEMARAEWELAWR